MCSLFKGAGVLSAQVGVQVFLKLHAVADEEVRFDRHRVRMAGQAMPEEAEVLLLPSFA